MKTPLLLSLFLAIGCSKDPMPQEADLGRDLAGPPGGSDLGAADLEAPEDLTGEPVSVTGLPQGCPTGVTAEQLYNEVVSRACAADSRCHGAAEPSLFGFGSAAEMRTRWVNKTSTQARMVRIKPGSIDQSYVMFKLAGQQAKPGGGGERMPKGQPTRLPNEDLCKFISWIKAGAN